MTNWIDVTNSIDIAINDEDLISVLTKDSVTLYSTQFSTALESHNVRKAENIFGDSKCVFITGKTSDIYTIDIETSTMRSKAVLPGISKIKGCDYQRSKKMLLFQDETIRSSTKNVLVYDVSNNAVTHTLETTPDTIVSNFRSNTAEIMTMTGNGVWSFYDLRGSSVKPLNIFKMGSVIKQGHAVDLSYCLTSSNGQGHLWTWNGQGKPQERWRYSSKEWLLGLIKGNGPQTIFALHGQHQNSKLTLTDVNDLSEYQTKMFHRYGVKDSKQALFDVLDGKVLATACNSGIQMQSAEFHVPNFKEYSRKLSENIRSAKVRYQKNKDQKEEEKVKSRWEDNAKKNLGVNAFDTKFTEHDFTMGGVLGSGQFGSVFEGKSKRTGKAVAIKVLVNRTSIYTEKFIVQREVDIQRELRHENIVKMYTAFKSKYAIFIVLELMSGTLHSILENEETKVLSETKMACMVQGVSNALVYCHRRGIIHRDLKPQNILHSNENVFKITDFGTATDERDNTYCGTLDFMAPEVLCRKKQSPAVDCFALGIIVHLCNEGSLPFLLADGQGCDEMKIKCKYEPPADMGLKIQEITRNLIKRDAKDRWTATEVVTSQLVRDYQHQMQDDIFKQELADL